MTVPLRGAAVAIAVAAIVACMFFYRQAIQSAWPLRNSAIHAPDAAAPSFELAVGTKNALLIDPVLFKRMGIKTAEAMKATLPTDLRLTGTLSLDPTRLQQVRSRFNGEVIELGQSADQERSIQFGDSVIPGQLLAVVWSSELGEKKSELIDAISQEHLDKSTRDRLAAIVDSGAVAGRELNEVERSLETDRVALNRVRRTLQTWRVTPEEIAAVEAEATLLIEQKGQASPELADRWARVEVRAAIGGTILEQNISVGDIVSTTNDLFKIADTSRLRVLASAYEEDLPRLDSLPPTQRQWTVLIPSDSAAPATIGEIDQIGQIIDPAQHTALVMGWVQNDQSRMRAGQFVSATIQFPAADNEVSVPTSAIVEKGGESLIFVTEQGGKVLARRSIVVSRQVGNQVCVLIAPPKGVSSEHLSGLKPGETVVVSGAVELQQALTGLTSDNS